MPKRHYPAWSGKFVSRRKLPSFEELKTGYLQHLTLRNLSPLSIKQNEQALRLFAAFLREQGVATVLDVEAETLERYKVELAAYRTRKGTSLLPATVRARVFIIQGWFRWLCRKGFIPHDPVSGVKPPRRSKKLPKGVMTVEEIKKVLAQPDLHNLIGYRDRAIMEVLYSTGMRSAELVHLEVRDLDFEKKTARIRNGKGDKERYVPLSPPCIRFLKRYLEAIRPELAEGIRPCGNSWLKKYRTGGDVLFLSLYGAKLTPTWLAQSLKRYIRQAGISRPVSPVHSWRHSVATHLMSSGMDIRYVQVMLGHSSVDTSQIYTHIEPRALSEKLKSCHPSTRRGRRFVPFLGEAAS